LGFRFEDTARLRVRVRVAKNPPRSPARAPVLCLSCGERPASCLLGPFRHLSALCARESGCILNIPHRVPHQHRCMLQDGGEPHSGTMQQQSGINSSGWKPLGIRMRRSLGQMANHRVAQGGAVSEQAAKRCGLALVEHEHQVRQPVRERQRATWLLPK